MSLKTEAISKFLFLCTKPELSCLYTPDMEVQVNVARDGGELVIDDYKGKQWRGWTDGCTTWKSFRIPRNANTEPEFTDSALNFDLAAHAEGIGMTGWNWKRRISQWAAFDFDAMIGHSDKHAKKLTDQELLDVKDALVSIPWITLRLSKSGRGLHAYVFLPDVPTNNHNEHAALARSILNQLSAITGFNFVSKVDICVPDNTWTLTVQGPKQVKEIINKETTLIVNGNKYETKGFFKTGNKEIFEIETVEGHKVQATAEHPFLVDHNGIQLLTELNKLQIGDKLCLNKHKNISWDGEGTFNEGYILGWLIGDGFLSMNKQFYMRNGLYFYGDDMPMVHYVKQLLKTEPSINYREETNSCILYSREIEELRLQFGLDERKQINTHIEQASSEFLSGFLSAFFDTDGTAKKHHAIVELSQSHITRLEAVQRILLRFGINSSIRKEHNGGLRTIQGRKCQTKSKFCLSIRKENVLVFQERIGFQIPEKRIKLELNLHRLSIGQFSKNDSRNRGKGQFNSSGLKKEDFLARIKSIKSIGFKDVYCVTVPNLHLFDANGFITKNCGGNMWVWHRNMATNGFQLVKQGTKLADVPENWREHCTVITGRRKKIAPVFIEEAKLDLFDELTGQRPKIPLDSEHKNLIKFLQESQANWWWSTDHHMLITHTIHLKEAFAALNMKGRFETVSKGTDHGHDHNCFMFPLRGGSWAVRRYSIGVSEAPTWEQDSSGWTRCYFNRELDLASASRLYEGLEHPKGGYIFRLAENAVKAANAVGANIDLSIQFSMRPAHLKYHKQENKMVFQLVAETTDDAKLMPGWLNEKGHWLRVINILNPLQDETENVTNYDDRIRHLINYQNEDAGWVLHSDGIWRSEPISNVKIALSAQGNAPKDVTKILGASVIKAWTLVNQPFQPEYPGNRMWNRDAAQLRFLPNPEKDNLSCSMWDAILNHVGKSLDYAIQRDDWCRQNAIMSGSDYLRCWIASLFKEPEHPLPYLFLYGDQNSGKSILHEMLGRLLTRGYIRADHALTNSSSFNAELGEAVLCVIEETDLRANKIAYNRIKDWVTSKQLSIHKKQETPYLVPNTTHYIQCANSYQACPIFKGDTRITMIYVHPLQKIIPKKELELILDKEAPDFLASILNIELPRTNDRLNIPVINTSEKALAEESNLNQFEQFLNEQCYNVSGHTLTFKEIYDLFMDWLDDENDRLKWSKMKVTKEFPPHYPKGRRPKDNAVVVGNISLNKDVLPGARYILRDGFLEQDNK